MTKTATLFGLTCLAALATLEAAQSLTLRDSLALIPAGDLGYVAPMTEAGKKLMLRTGLDSDGRTLEDHGAWLQIHEFNADSYIRLYPKKDGDTLVVLCLEAGYHRQVHSFLFYLYEAKTKKLTTLGDGEKVLGVHANDLLAQKQWFPAGRNFAVSLSLEDDGTIEVDPTLADDEVWEGKDIVYEIVFRWDGTGFVREIKRVQCRGACCRHLGAGGRGDLAG